MIDLKGIKGIIFDFDGTLLDSLGMWKNLDIEYLNQRGISKPADLGHAIEGLSFNETASYFKNRFSMEESVDEIVSHWHTYIEEVYPSLPFKASAKNFIERRKKEGYKLAIATSNSKPLVKMALEDKMMERFFPIIVTSDDVGEGKPSPNVFLETAKRLQIHPSDCLVIEDTYMGVLGAKRAGMKTIAIFDSHNKERWDKTLKLADGTVTHFKQLEAMF